MGPPKSCWNSTSALQPEEITSKGGLEFHVCIINKSAHTKKTGNLFNDPCVCVCVYIYMISKKFLDTHS